MFMMIFCLNINFLFRFPELTKCFSFLVGWFGWLIYAELDDEGKRIVRWLNACNTRFFRCKVNLWSICFLLLLLLRLFRIFQVSSNQCTKHQQNLENLLSKMKSFFILLKWSLNKFKTGTKLNTHTCNRCNRKPDTCFWLHYVVDHNEDVFWFWFWLQFKFLNF